MTKPVGITHEQAKRAYQLCGSAKGAARMLNVSNATISYWLKNTGITTAREWSRKNPGAPSKDLKDYDPLLEALRREHKDRIPVLYQEEAT